MSIWFERETKKRNKDFSKETILGRMKNLPKKGGEYSRKWYLFTV